MVSDAELGAAFHGLSDGLRLRLARVAIERRIGRGQTLFRAGDEPDGLYVVLSGRLRVSRETAEHVELLHTESVGGVLGEIPIFGGGPFPSTAVALEPSRCALIPKAAIETLLRESPEFCRFAIHRLARRAQSFLARIDELTALTITARVAQFVRRRAADGTEFDLGESQARLAEELGTAREVVVRAIADLIRRGALERVGRSRFAVADREALEIAAGER
jgi:CRP/FNR family transcriptional regulator